jgi:hypothetical protein
MAKRDTGKTAGGLISRIDELLPLTPVQLEAIKQKSPERATW